MRDRRAEALRKAIAEKIREDEALRLAYANLRETCAFAIDPRNADQDLARLLIRFVDGGCRATPVSPYFKAVRAPLRDEIDASVVDVRPNDGPKWMEGLLHDGVRTLLRDVFGRELSDVAALDPWAGAGELIVGLRAAEVFANEADPIRYTDLVANVGEGAVLADSFRLPERVPTLEFDFGQNENVHRVNEEQTRAFTVIVSDLRRATLPDIRARRRTKETWGDGIAAVRWMADRLAPAGVIAFVSDREFVDDPRGEAFRAGLVGEFGSIAHVALPDGVGVTFLVRGGSFGQIRYAKVDLPPDRFEAIEWAVLEPSPEQVWRPEILSEAWPEMPPLAVERGAIFRESSTGMPVGTDTLAPGRKTRRILSHPFVTAWRKPDRKTREGSTAGEPTIVVLDEPFGAFASILPVDRGVGGPKSRVLAIGGRVTTEALRRFRTVYGAAVTEQDVFDVALALLHHPDYSIRYHEDLRRSVPRLPMPSVESLAALIELPGSPQVGPGTAFRTGWLEAERFEPGTVPDYDDPFASPYAREEIDPGFLLLVGLGAALYRVEVDIERLLPYPLEMIGEPRPLTRMRLLKDRTRLSIGPDWTLEGIPPECYEHRIGRWSAPEWVVEGLRARAGFDPNLTGDAERPARLFAQAVAASLEILRLAKIVGIIPI